MKQIVAKWSLLVFLVDVIALGSTTSIKLSLDSEPDVGLFIKLPEDNYDNELDDYEDEGGIVTKEENDFADSIRYLALLDAAHSPVSVRASLGPMSVRETLYPMNYEPDSENAFDELFKANASHRSEWLDSPTPAQLTVASWQLKDTLSAHLVTTEVKRSSPVVRVLFYAGHRSTTGHGRLAPASVDSSAICAVISVVSDSGQDKVFAACSPTNSRDGACVAELVVPATWWPALDVDGTPKRRKPSMVKVNYIVVQGPKAATCGPESGQQGRQQSSERIVSWLTTATRPQLPSDPLGVTWLGHVALVPYEGSYEEITNDDIVRILVPQEPVFVMSKVYVSVCFRRNPGYPVAAFSVRVRVKSGLRVVGAQLSKDTPWQISTEISGKQSMATITAYLRDSEYLQQDGVSPSKAQGKHHGVKAKNGQPSQEVFVLLMEIDESAIDMTDSGRVVWQVVYTTDNVGPGAEKMGNNGDRDGAKLTSRFNIQKDEVESLVGVTRKTQILNTAVLSGRQVAQQLRVFVVSRSGKPGDVTLQATCHSQDESILKVSHSCTSVYVDGSEIRGSTNATILVKYGAVVKAATFVVWMPKLPIEIRVSDDKLSQIKSWKTPHLTRRSHGNGVMADSAHRRPRHPTQSHEAHHDSDLGCRLRYQQAYVELTTNFYSVDHESGREESLLSRRVFFQVTDLGLAFLRLTDPRVALLRGNVIEGLSPGRTELQLVSPITGKVIGSKELKVTLDKEAITQLEVDLVSGITLNLEPDDSGGRIWQVRASTINKMASLYQEGLLDARIHFSDGSVTALADVTESDFHLSVDIFESGMIAYAPKSGLAYPRVLAIGQGSGQLIHVSLEVAPQCQKKRTQQLAMTHVAVNVDFTSTQPPTTSVQNDAYHLRKYNGSRGTFDRNAKRGRETGASLRDKLKRSRTSQSDADSGVQAHHRHGMTPLQVGMYALLAVFSLAVFIFVASCMVFAVRLRGKPPSGADTPVVTAVRLLPQSPVICHANQPKKVRLLPNATDRNWVWLDRATLDVSRPIPVPTRHRIDLNGNPVQEEAVPPVVTRKTELAESKPLLTMTAPRAVDKNGQRMSAMSYQGSEISILINPSAVGDNSDEESCIESENLSDSFVGSTETGHSSSSRRVDPMITSGRSGRYRLLVNEGIQRSSGTSSTEDETLPPIPQRRHRTTNSTSSMRPPPVPPHRTAQTSKRPTARAVRPTELALAISTVAAATARTPTPEPVVPPPPVPAHTHQRKTTKGRIPKPPRTTPPPVPIHRTVRRPVRGDSVESSNSNSNSESDWQERAKNMDQSELLEYVSNLKESSA